MTTHAFTCTGPYAILIMLGIKRVENRSALPVPAKGRCAVGCSKSFCKEEYGNFVQWASRALSPEDFAVAFRTGAASVVLAHNHPSGDPTPSLQDRQLTDALVGIGGRLGIRVVDHLVIGATEFKSIQDTKE